MTNSKSHKRQTNAYNLGFEANFWAMADKLRGTPAKARLAALH